MARKQGTKKVSSALRIPLYHKALKFSNLGKLDNVTYDPHQFPDFESSFTAIFISFPGADAQWKKITVVQVSNTCHYNVSCQTVGGMEAAYMGRGGEGHGLGVRQSCMQNLYISPLRRCEMT